jgi:hypothetical protein
MMSQYLILLHIMCSLIIIQEGVGYPVSGATKQDIINQVTHKN